MKLIQKRIVIRIIEVVLIGLIVFSGYKIIDIKLTEYREENQFEQMRHKVDSTKDQNKEQENIKKDTKTNPVPVEENQVELNPYETLYKENNDYVGWLSIPDTPIDYPVMSTPNDPNYYLKRNFNKEYSASGTPFIGDGVNCDKKAFVIYAHSMNNGSMFGTLEKYKDFEYKNKHPFMMLNTEDEKRKYEIIAAFYADLESEHFPYYDYYGDLSEETFKEYVHGLSEVSLYDNVKELKYEDQIVMLSTCSNFRNEGRFIVVTKRVE